ncbi:dioxygenase family protein [Ideonella livida]|uniref:Intradiol ring-cleavage dioxygenase n=1 Tax=Ideonella livida TaxID=2707176 RepID=A0A7C9TLC7_9BURK|nr:intradiol ring-cleavage dioxygenase [Ideonella livida]NDY92502.1 intradiol ring-cleavage dioxygenase [Ideonella livida]
MTPTPTDPVPLPVLDRRRLLALGGWAVLPAAALVACGGSDDDRDPDRAASTGSGSDSSSATGSTSASCPGTATPTETGGPYPADGSNANSGSTVDVLALAGILRRDIRSNIGSATLKDGTPLTLTLTITTGSGCTPVGAGVAVYIWHCDKDGEYSAYSGSANGSHAGEQFLRGVQLTDAQGQVTFTTVYPGWYAGRMTHIHFEVYTDGDYARGTPALTSQIAFPEAVTQAVYATALYGHSPNTSVTFSSDNVFSDGYATQLLTLADGGSPATGYTGSLVVRLS